MEEGDEGNNSCVSIYFQNEETNSERLTAINFLEALREDEFFDDLRTK